MLPVIAIIGRPNVGKSTLFNRLTRSRDALVAQIRQRAVELGIELGADTQTLASDEEPNIPRPPHWGGIRVWASGIELWKDGADRIHDRAIWTRKLIRSSEHEFATTPWTGTRLQP